MSDYFRSIGFTLERPELEHLLQRTLEAGRMIAAERGDYHVWAPGGGPELWAGTYRLSGDRRELAGANPHFSGEAHVDVVVEGLEPDPDFPLEGNAYAWPASEAGEHALYPFSASIPDFDSAAARRDLPFRATLALVGFARELTFYENEATLREMQRREPVGVAAAAIVPIGLFGHNAGRARSQAQVTGEILLAERRVNPVTERPYQHYVLSTYGGTLDIVAAPDVAAEPARAGAIARAACWLSARILASGG